MLKDTDSLIYHHETDYVSKGMYEIKEHFDFSSLYAEENGIHCKNISEKYIKENNSVVGKLKEDISGCVVKEEVCLQSECYSYEKCYD